MEHDPILRRRAGRRAMAALVVAIAIAWTALSLRSSDAPTSASIALEQPTPIAPETGGERVELELAESDPELRAALEVLNTRQARRARLTKRVNGLAHPSDTTLGVRCEFSAFDPDGEPTEILVDANSVGLFAVRVPPEAAVLRLRPARRFDLEVVDVELPRGDADALDVVLPYASGVVKGQVVDPSGAGVSGIQVTLDGSYARRTTGSTGFFLFRPLRDETYAIAVADVPFAAGESPRKEVVVEGGQQRGTLLFVVERGATLSGTTVDRASGKPVAGATVVLTRPGSRDTRVERSGSDGTFLFPRLVGGSYDLVVTTDQEYGRAHMPVVGLELREQREIKVKLSAAAGQVSGTVVDDEGRPLPFVELLVERGEGGERQVIHARSDSAGRYDFPALAAGQWEISADPSWCEIRNWIAGAYREVAVTDGGHTSCDVSLRRGRYVRGRVHSASKRRDIQVRLSPQDGQPVEKSMGKQGHFAFGGLASGIYVIEALDPAMPDGPPLLQTQVYVTPDEDARIDLDVP